MASSEQIAKLKAEVGNVHGGSRTLFDDLRVTYLGVPEREHFPKVKNADGSKKLDALGHEVRAEKSDGWTYTFSEIGTSKMVMAVLPEKVDLDWFGVYKVVGLGYNLRNANMLFLDQATRIGRFE